ncbi:MAG TPA: hypothetical protein VHM69_16945, partial [Rubrobacter sp.]|nr:hypothetical protein [Rubrobacter sp.]
MRIEEDREHNVEEVVSQEVLPSMIKWWQQRSLFTRLLAYAVAATLAFVMAASVGAIAALVVSGNLSWPTGEKPRPEGVSPAGEQGDTPQRQQSDADRPKQERAGATKGDQAASQQAASQQVETTYVHEVGEIQANSVETFLDSHNKLLRYDALTTDDVEELQANQAALKASTHQASELNAPRKYSEQNETFLSAINELQEAVQLAYTLAADPTSATQS